MVTGAQILDDLKTAYDKVFPVYWYAVTEMCPRGKILTVAASEFFPHESHHIHPDDWAQVHRELSQVFRMRDVRSWRPEGAIKPTIIEGEIT